MTEQQEHDIIRRYVQGASINLLAIDMGVSRTLIRKLLRAANVLRGQDGERHSSPRYSPSPEEIREITERIREGKVQGFPKWTKRMEMARMGANAPQPVTIPTAQFLGVERQGTSTSRGSGG